MIEVNKGERIKKRREQIGLTQVALADMIGESKQTIYKYETGIVTNIPSDKIELIAKALRVQPEWIMGWTDTESVEIPPGFEPLPKMRKVPLIGEIACGEPILAEQNIEDYLEIPEEVHCDFLLRCNGDSMIDTGIQNGDVVFVRIQQTVENGEIAAVRIEDKATLKRVYWDGNTLTLMPANSQYAPLSFRGEEINDIHIEGKAIGYMHIF